VGRQLRTDAVEVTVCYESGVVGRYYHEFGFPHDVEYASGVVVFEAGHVAIEGWIPTRLTGAAAAASSGTLVEIAASCDVALDVTAGDGVVRFQASFPDRSEQYQKAIAAGMRDLVRRHRDPQHRPAVTAQDGRASLALALAAQRACDTNEIVLV
jgi:hypothetical protein